MSNNEEFFGLSDDMFGGTTIPFHAFKNGQHKFRLLPPYAQGKLVHKLSIHWGLKDVNNKIKALQCSKDFENKCPICEMVEKLEKQKVAYEQAQRIGEAKALEKVIGDQKRKPTYLWNILTAEGEQKVLRLSWNGSDPLLNKVKFMWNEKKVNVTDPRANWLIYCERTGEAAKTRYVYEMLENAVKPIEVPKLHNLEEIYKIYTYAELKGFVDAGQVGVTNATGSSDSFVKEMEAAATLPAAAAAQLPPIMQPASVPDDLPVTWPAAQAAAAPVEQAKQTSPLPSSQVQMNQAEEDEVQRMLAALNAGGAK